MDKLRVVLDFVRKHHFWLLCGVAVIGSLAGWWLARSSLSDEFDKGKANINSKFSSLEQIQQNPFPPNNDWKAGIGKLTDLEREKVSTAWKAVYAEQQKVLEWPAVLGDRFKQDIQRWIAANNPTDPTKEIIEALRLSYRNLVRDKEFERLLAIVDAKAQLEDDSKRTGVTTPAPATTARAPGAGAATAAADDKPERKYKVIWAGESQDAVNNSLKMSEVAVPSTYEVSLKQEDLWVYGALLNIIRATNKDTTYTSRVKHIESLAIGVEAAKLFQDGMKPGKIEIARVSNEDGSTTSSSQSNPADGATKAIDDGRYVGRDGNPISGTEAKSQQFKRMPVHMTLKMDQREINRLLTECANSPLPVEVRQLRINANAEAPGGSRPPASAARGNQADDASPTAPDIFDVTLDINGIIYIYNPPDPAKLGTQPAAAAAAGG